MEYGTASGSGGEVNERGKEIKGKRVQRSGKRG
jgi:hypothetical protein